MVLSCRKIGWKCGSSGGLIFSFPIDLAHRTSRDNVIAILAKFAAVTGLQLTRWKVKKVKDFLLLPLFFASAVTLLAYIYFMVMNFHP